MRFPAFAAVILSLSTGGALASPDVTPASAPMTPSGLMFANECKSVATFTASAAPELRAAGCLGCHAGGMTDATSAFDLTKLGTDDAAACRQALKKVDLANKPRSAILQSPTGPVPHAGGKVADATSFSRAIRGWIDNE
jgi:hypothetical protein